MPQFVQNGPTIPERLLQAHEEGRVVFFCGAGISYPARLPGFRGLVEELYRRLEPNASGVQKLAIKSKQYDTAVGLLEAVVGRERVRRTMVSILTPDLSSPKATATHKALLSLGRTRDGRTRLITTNFDRLFEEVTPAAPFPVHPFQAPLLPVPKNRWDGLVYLHGLLSEDPTVSELDRLVISSGDFGLAYLTERWAARFVSELFRNYTVCFVGYSIADPVLRYMMDALAADRLLGESSPEMFAFGSYSRGEEDDRANEWEAKNVTPILYKEHRRHAYLHNTLQAWAATYRDGVRGKERIVVESAIARPLASTKEDDFVSRLLWALSDRHGLPAQRFADLEPVPSLDWLEPLSEARFGHIDLARYGVPPNTNLDKKLAFSLMRRPLPYSLALVMCVVESDGVSGQWDPVMGHLARWLTRHLDDPVLLLWLINWGGRLHVNFASSIEHCLERLATLEREGKTDELARMRAGAPNAVPGPLMRTLWQLMLGGRVKVGPRAIDFYRWRNRFHRDGLTSSLRLEFRELLSPRVSLREPYSSSTEDGEGEEQQRLKDLVEWEIVLMADDVHSNLKDLSSNERWKGALPGLLADLTGLLRDALDLMRELGGADDRRDNTYMQQPSIDVHPQNNEYNDWTALIDLTRDAWLATAAASPARAALEAEIWWTTPYPIFKRLAFFAATKLDVIDNSQALFWLLADDHWWLWSSETERESTRLLVALVEKRDPVIVLALEQAILTGPPTTMLNGDPEPERLARILDREVWLRLAKVVGAGATLSPAGQQRLDALSQQYPDWALKEDQSDEFPYWTGSGDDWRKFTATPRRRRDLIEWLKQHQENDYFQQDDWRDRCRDDFATTACALWALAQENLWPASRWREALQAWSEGKLVSRAWRYMAPVLVGAPDEAMEPLAHGVSSWLRTIAKTFVGHEEEFFTLGRRVLELHNREGSETDDPVGRAINHPVGQVTEAFLHWWYRRSLEDGQELPVEIKPTFTELCDGSIEKYRHGRVLLAAHVIALFRVDPVWAVENLLPHFEWQHSEHEARAVWEGFLWSPRLYRPLMEVLKPAFLDTARHFAALGKHGGQYASLLTFAALDPGDTFTYSELAGAVRALPTEGLRYAANALVNALEGAGEQRADYWKNRVTPFINNLWPKGRDVITPVIAETLARLCVAAGAGFPEAIEMLCGWLQPLGHPDAVVRMLNKADLCRIFPEQALDFLSQVVGEQTQWPPSDLATCLDVIRNAAPELEADNRFERLQTYLRMHGRG
ncbi:anti-phage defense-associated sirtuin Dsr1 [Pseudomonas veronii]|uniref:anti-phage defense-associated sirtuin Dsr1 n=1 Tax=Pseudomonas veronii TaxID=76761 RepID=UPI0021C089B5|nr:anti-phage defense-associated sirtuin Dsr1 [Pseudomonas veronii]MCT9827415.1 SIR2 family protein [Pseudomonas veronii]